MFLADMGCLQRLPIIGDTFRKEVPASDNVSSSASFFFLAGFCLVGKRIC